jgi:hypothetical protein
VIIVKFTRQKVRDTIYNNQYKLMNVSLPKADIFFTKSKHIRNHITLNTFGREMEMFTSGRMMIT